MLSSRHGILAEAVRTTFWSHRIYGPTDLFFLYAYDHSTKMYGPPSFSLFLCTTIGPKIRALIDLFLLCAYDHSIEIYAIVSKIFWDLLMFYQIFLSPQVNQCAIVTCKLSIYELPHELPNNIRNEDLRKCGNTRKVSKRHSMIEW